MTRADAGAPALRIGQSVVKDGCGVFGVLRKSGSRRLSSLVAVNGVSCIKYRGSSLGAGYASFDVSQNGSSDVHRIQAFVTEERVVQRIRLQLEELGSIEEATLQEHSGASNQPRLRVWEAVFHPRKKGTETLLESTVDSINRSLTMNHFEGRIFSYGTYVRVYKEVGYPLDVARAWGLDQEKAEADLWLAHTRQPTNSPGTLPIWSHPFASMNAAIVHNGDISSFGSNMDLLGSWGLRGNVGTDSEVIARLLDHLVRVEGLSIREAATVMINPFERHLPKALLELLLKYSGARLDGPFAVVGGYADAEDLYLVALTDRSKFRPMIIGEDENCFYVASEENQIRNQSPEADVWTPDPGSFFLASLRKGMIEDGTRRSRATQARLSRPPSTNPRSGHPAIDARGKEYKEINNAISETYGEGKEGIVIEGCAGQRYLGIGFSTRKENGKGPFKITINGFPGNCLANLNDGASFEIFGNVADDLADTMHSGSVIVHGNARDVVGQALQGGEIMVRGCVGNRAGIQMREYKKSRPVIIVGETADDYLGEYMAGGTLLVLNLGDSPRPTGSYIGTGMVGGKIYIRGTFDESRIGLPPPREDILNYLRMSALEGQISPEALEQISRAEYPTMETLSRNLPVELAQRLSSLFFSPSKRNNPIVVEKRLLSEDDLRLVRDEIKGFFKVFSLPDQLLEKVMKSVFTVIAAGDQKAQVRVPPQEVPVEE